MFAALQGILSWLPIGLPAFLFVVTVVVFFHELGHFAVARAFGVRVETFSIGFGPAIVQWFDRKGTQWKISWVPLGGYVKFFGDMSAASTPDREKIEGMSAAERAQAFPFKPLYQRALVVFAGPAANFILAILVFATLFCTVGAPVFSTIVGTVTPHSPAAAAGIRPGDKILAINGTPVREFDRLRLLIQQAKGKPLAVEILHGARTRTLTIVPRTLKSTNFFGDPITTTGLGVAAVEDPRNLIYIRFSPPTALAMAAGETWTRVDLTLTYVGRILIGRSDTSQLHGPIGIMGITKKQASEGPVGLIWLIAVLSVSIGLINLFPIPILDGGHLLYYACEAVLGRPLGERAQDVGFRLGLAVVLGLFFLATWNDLVRPNLF
jgi:regulator of sigma E protease